MAKDLPVKYGNRIEFDQVSRMYTIHRPATSERGALDYKISELEVMKLTPDPSAPWTSEHLMDWLFDERVDEQLRPIQRREAIEHTRRKLGL